MEFTRTNKPDAVDLDFKVSDEKKLRLEPVTEEVTKLREAGLFTQNALSDFSLNSTSSVDGAESEPKQVTVFQAPALPQGITVGTLFSDGTAGIGIKVGGKTWATYTIPQHVREILFKLHQQNGLIPVGAESRITATKVYFALLFSLFSLL